MYQNLETKKTFEEHHDYVYNKIDSYGYDIDIMMGEI